MLYFTRAQVAQALNYLCHGNSGGPLTRDQFLWELNVEQNGPGFGCCLKLAAANPDAFPEVNEAPFMRRSTIRRQNVIVEDGATYTMPAGFSCDASGSPISFDIVRWWMFPEAALSD